MPTFCILSTLVAATITLSATLFVTLNRILGRTRGDSSQPPASVGISDEMIRSGELWRYFESRGSEVKNTMLSVVTWVVALTTALLGFSVQNWFVSSLKRGVVTNTALTTLSLLGVALTVYAEVLIYDFGAHIQRNFDRADRARNVSNSLDQIIGVGAGSSTTIELPLICRRLRLLIRSLCFAFIALALLGVANVPRLLEWIPE